MNFLPQDYKIPSSGNNYMKLQEGPNTFRILSSAITGWEYWNLDSKPVRSKNRPEKPENMKLDKSGKPSLKHFWAFVIWNYDSKSIQIMEITQKSIMQAVSALVKNPKWGDPKMYDITITRTGDGMDTEYFTQAEPPIEKPDLKIISEQKKRPVNLEALYEGADPFSAEPVTVSETNEPTDEDLEKAGLM